MSKDMTTISSYKKYCMDCNSLEDIKICICLDGNNFSRSNKLKATVTDYDTAQPIDMACKSCGSINTTILDDKIAVLVSKLNAKGYKTKYSCEGHASIISDGGYNYSLPYVSFDESIPILIFNTLPEGWHVSWSDFNRRPKFGLNAAIYYRNENAESSEERIDFDVDSIINWADSLPDNKEIEVRKLNYGDDQIHLKNLPYNEKYFNSYGG